MINEIDLSMAYLKFLFKKWYTVASIILTFLGLLLMFYDPSMIVLIVIVLILSFFGIISSGYLVYRSLFKVIPDEYSLAYLPPKIGNPKINVYQSGGAEYSYGYYAHPNRLIQTVETREVLPTMASEFNFVIKNIGYVPVNVLSISGDINIITPLQFLVPDAIGCEKEPIRYPIELKHEEEIKIILFFRILPFSLLTDAQIAVRIRELLSLRKVEDIVVRIEISDINGRTTRFKETFSFSTEHLFDLYIDNWRYMNEKELLRIVGVK